MAKKSVKKKGAATAKAKSITEQIRSVKLAPTVEDAMKVYGTMTVEDRAIPDFRDGCKPVQRRILWAMYTQGFSSKSGFKKSATTVGEVMGKYHPHGDQSIYEAMVNMVNFPDPLIDGQGNFGWYDSSQAAMRYTEARLNTFTEKVLLNPYYMRVIDMVPNFSGEHLEPVVLPAMLPMSLLTGAQGIAVGTTTAIPSFTAESVYALIEAVLKRANKNKAGKTAPKCTLADCNKHLEMTYKYGGVLYEENEDLDNVYRKGEGRIDWSCDGEYDSSKKQYIISGFAPGWNYTNRYEKLSNLPGVKVVRDNSSGKEGIKIVIEFMNGASTAQVIKDIEDILHSTMTYRINVIERKKVSIGENLEEAGADFRSVGVIDIVNQWLEWRAKLEVLALKAELLELKEKLDRELLMQKAINHLDVIFKLLKQKGIDKNAALSKALKITVDEAKIIWAMAVGRLDRLSADEVAATITKLRKRASEVKAEMKVPYVNVAKKLPELGLA